MYKKKKIVCIIPARKNSQGIKNKNIRKIREKPLIFFPIQAALNSKYIDEIYVNSDSEKILKIAKDLKIKNIYLRSRKLGGNKIKIFDVIKDNISKKSLKNRFDYILLLEPTSPLTTHKEVDKAIKKIVDENFNSLVSICDNSIPNLNYEIKIKKNLVKFKNNEIIKRQNRQNFKKLYFACGALYLSKINTYLKYKSFVQNKTGYIKLDKSLMFEIDDMVDFKIVKMLMEN